MANFFWMKLKDNFFDDGNIRILRKLKNGADMVIVYLKLQLKSITTEGLFRYKKVLPTLHEEVAMFIDEDAEIVKDTIDTLKKLELIEITEDEDINLLAVKDSVGAGNSSTERVRKYRERKKQEQQDQEQSDAEVEQSEDAAPKPKSKAKPKQKLDKSVMDNIWSKYPKKSGKADSFKKMPKLIETYGADQVERCVDRYNNDIAIKGTQAQYILSGSTFFNGRIEDYLDDNYTEAVASTKPDWMIKKEEKEMEELRYLGF